MAGALASSTNVETREGSSPFPAIVTVVQLVRTVDCGSTGRRFESAQSPHHERGEVSSASPWSLNETA